MSDRALAIAALVVGVFALVWTVVHTFTRDSSHGGPAHTVGIGGAT